MRYRLLGRLEATGDDGQVISLAASKERAVLAALLVNANRGVSVGRLIDVLWGDRPPASAVNALQVQVSRLRKKLAVHTDREVLVREPAGYRLKVGPGELDADRFQELANVVEGDAAETSRRLAEALGLWNGPALADVDSDALRGEAVRLEELRWTVLERRIDADLELGRHRLAVPELEAVVADEPLREGFTRQLMVALYRSGRQAEALAVYRRTREVLAEELGIDPSPGLQALESAVLNQAAELELPPVDPTPPTTRALPSGTVTFLFTDIEGSTRLVAEMGGERYGLELVKHRTLLREVIVANQGIEVAIQGHALSAVFRRALDALAAAQEIQKGTVGSPLRVQVGVHTGEPLVIDGNYVGLDVDRAARICSAAHSGQVLVSQSTRDLVDTELEDLGDFRLSDLVAPVRLYQLGTDHFPPPRGLRSGNLPVQPTPLLGRHRELADVTRLMGDHRLVTLTGPGGSGKTRLALQAAAEVAEQYRDGVWWLPLAAVADPELVVPTMAQTLRAAGTDLTMYLADRKLLVVADSFERLLDAAPLLGDLLSAAAGLSILATSRERLGLSGEQEYPVTPLDDETAAELFTTRARQVKPDFVPDERVGEICRRLDRLPLAVEMASTRAKVMTTAQILTRLNRRFEFLTGMRRDAPSRQWTMKATIDWSYDLLAPDEQRVFRGLGVFAGGFELEAAEQVCSAGIDQVHSLVDKSLLYLDGEQRLFLLDTTREYAQTKLEDTGELEPTQCRHAQWFFDLAAASSAAMEAHGGLGSLPGSEWTHRLATETDNLRAAFDWTLHHDPARAVELATNLVGPWNARGQSREMTRWFERALAMSPNLEPELRAKATFAFATTFLDQGDYTRMEALCHESLALYRQTGNQRGQAQVLVELANATYGQAPKEAANYLENALGIFRRLDHLSGTAAALNNLGNLWAELGELDEAEAALEESVQLEELSGNRYGLASSTHSLGDLALIRGDAAKAERCYREALRMAAEADGLNIQVHCLAGLACVAAAHQDPRQAGRLWGIVKTSQEQKGLPLYGESVELYATALAELQTSAQYKAGMDTGLDVTFEQVIQELLSNAAVFPAAETQRR